MPIVQGPDGAQINFPDDTPQSVMESAMRAHYGTTAPETGGLADTINSAYNSYMRGSGLVARTAVDAIPSAVLGLPALAMDAYDATKNIGKMGWNAAAPYFGGDQVDVPAPFAHTRALRDIGESAANLMDLPEAKTKIEQGLMDVGSAGLSALGGAGVAGSLGRAAAASPRVASVMGDLASLPGLQAAGAAGSAGASIAAREGGLSPNAQFGVGLIGALAPGGAASLGERALGGVGALAAPFRSVGEGGFLPGVSRDVITGKVLNKLATRPGMTPSVMDAAQPIVPGSEPTISQVSRDPGLIAAEGPIMDALGGTGQLALRKSDQNAARQAALDNIIMPNAQNPQNPERGSLEYAQAKRDSTVDTNKNAAFTPTTAQLGMADPTPVLDAINTIRKSSSTGPRKAVQDAMSFAEERLSQPGINPNDPETLYSIRKDLGLAREGKYNTDKSDMRLAKGELQTVIGKLDNVIDSAAPGYRKYMDLYAKRSIPLNQQEAMSNLRTGSQQPLSDPIAAQQGQKTMILAPGKFQTKLQKFIASGDAADAHLSNSQMSILQDVGDDLDRGAAAQSGTIKAPGSDTFRNLSMANIIGRVMGDNFPDTAAGQAVKTFAVPLSWMYKQSGAEEAVGELLKQAVLDPKLAARLQRMASRSEIEAISAELARRAAQQSKGAALYGNDR